MTSSKEDIQEIQEILIESFGFKDCAEIYKVAQNRFGHTGKEAIALLHRSLRQEAFKEGALRQAAYYTANPKEQQIDFAIQQTILELQDDK